MKNLKKISYLLVIIAFTISCEKEKVELEILNEVQQNKELTDFNSMSEAVEAGFDFKTFQESLHKKSKKTNLSSKIVDEETGLTYFTDSEEFDLNSCDNLVLENLEPTNLYIGQGQSFINPLDENSDNFNYKPGDIASNITITSNNLTNPSDPKQLYGFFYNNVYMITANYFNDFINIDFSTEVNTVSFEVSKIYTTGSVEVGIYSGDQLLDVTTISNVNTYANGQTFFGIQSDNLITRITVNGIGRENEFTSNIRFGYCLSDSDEDGILNADDNCPSTPNADQADNDEDGMGDVCDDDDDNDGILDEYDNCPFSANANQANYDGDDEGDVCDDDGDNDGVMNNKDAHIYSLLGGKIHILDCYPNVNNVLVRNGSTMMDQIGDLISEINAEYNGSNYDYLHRKFIMLLERKVTDWRRNRLVNNSQRDAILRCAGSASIPYTDQ